MGNMFDIQDNTYNEIRERSLMQWLDEMEQHEDVAVRGGVRLAKDYIQYLKQENQKMEEKNQLVLAYMKKLKEKS